MRLHLVFASILLLGCNAQTDQIPDSAKIHQMIDGQLPETLKQSFNGCEWKPYSFKTNPPLTGQLNLSILYCPSDKKMRPQYGYNRIYSLNDKNEVVEHRTPHDPKFPDTKNAIGPYLSIEKIEGNDVQNFMNKFVKTDINPNCKIRENSTGLWQIGFEQTYLEKAGWVFKENCPKSPPFGSEEKTINCINKDSFPTARTGARDCVEDEDPYADIDVYRVSGPVVFKYHKPVIEPHPEDQALIDKSSVAYIEFRETN